VQRGEFEFLGIVIQLCVMTPQGERWIVFPPPAESRPSLARFFSDSLPDLIDPWPYDGLPTLYIPTDEPCPDCLVPCEECAEIAASENAIDPTQGATFYRNPTTATSGWFDEAIKNGTLGNPPSGKSTTANPGDLAKEQLIGKTIKIDGVEKEFLPGERPCIYGDQWNACGGTGVLPNDEICPSCDGTCKVGCKRCGGDGTYKKMGTGLMASGKTPDGKSCESCGGTARVRNKVEQPLLQYLDSRSCDGVIGSSWASLNLSGSLIIDTSQQNLTVGSLRETIYLGPITQMWLSGQDKHTQIWKGTADDEGNYPHIVSRNGFQFGTRSVILGGVLRRQPSARKQTKSSRSPDHQITRSPDFSR
jgi:hypothetical protein